MLPDDTKRQVAGDVRSVSEVVAVVLLVGIVLLGVVAILLVGGSQIGDDQNAVEVGQAEQALTQFDDDAARVATGSTTSQEVDLGLRVNRGTLDVDDDAGHITIEYVDFFDNGSTTRVMDTSLGAVIYESGETTVGYQGGGVWRSDPNGSVMISPPEITFRGKTLTMPVVKSTRGGSVHSDVEITRVRSEERFPDKSRNLTNKVEGAEIIITIESRYYLAWGRFFEDEADTIVQYNHEEERVVILFLALPENFAPDAGVIATSGPGEIRLEGTGAYINSYDSSQGTYAETNGTNGTVKAAGDIIMKGDSQIDGESNAGRNISVGSSSAQIDGDAYANDTVHVTDNDSVTGKIVNGSADVPDIPPIDELVEKKTEELQAANDNDQTNVIVENELQIDGTNNTIGPGEYYLERIDLQGETLNLNASEGNITIAVRDWVNLEKSGGTNSHLNITQGDGRVRIFVASKDRADVSIPGHGQAPTNLDEVHFFVERNGTIDVPGDRAIRFQIFAPAKFDGAIGGSNSENADVVSTVVAPAGPEGPGQFYVQQGELFGAVVTGNLTLGQYGQVHFDRALEDLALPLAPEVPRIEYLWLSENEIEVADG